MSQGEVLEVLQKNKKPMSASDISNVLHYCNKNVYASIKRLKKSKMIKIIEIDRYQAMKLYHCKKRMQLYYV